MKDEKKIERQRRNEGDRDRDEDERQERVSDRVKGRE